MRTALGAGLGKGVGRRLLGSREPAVQLLGLPAAGPARLTVAVAAQPHQVAFGAAHNGVEQVVAVVVLRLHASRGGMVGRASGNRTIIEKGGRQLHLQMRRQN